MERDFLLSGLQLATGMLAAVEELHSRRLVHRDIKPGNFCLGPGGQHSTVYLVDFGFVQSLPQRVCFHYFLESDCRLTN